MSLRPEGRRGPLADRLRAARAARDLSQAQAAAELGVALRTLAAWESGTSQPRGLTRVGLEAWLTAALHEKRRAPAPRRKKRGPG